MIPRESYSYSQFIYQFCMQKTSPGICSDILLEHRYTSTAAACPRRMLCTTVYNSLAVEAAMGKCSIKCYPLFNRITKSS